MYFSTDSYACVFRSMAFTLTFIYLPIVLVRRSRHKLTGLKKNVIVHARLILGGRGGGGVDDNVYCYCKYRDGDTKLHCMNTNGIVL